MDSPAAATRGAFAVKRSTPLAAIAASLGLSTSTMSRALRRPELVKPETRTAIMIAAKKAGYSVDVVADGQKGLEAAQTDQYDLILLDLMVPTITGIEILRALRGPEATSPVRAKIIITTNLEQREDVRSDIEKQADAYLVKAELTPHELVDFLDTVK